MIADNQSNTSWTVAGDNQKFPPFSHFPQYHGFDILSKLFISSKGTKLMEILKK